MPHFTWNPSSAIRPCLGETTPVQSHHAALSELRSCIGAGQSIRVQNAWPTAHKANHPQLFCETGGSTGTPKVIARSHASWIASFRVNQKLFDITPDDCTAVFSGIGYSLALYGVVEAAHIGADICMLAGLRPKAQVAELQRHGATILYITPTQLKLLTAPRIACPAVRHIIVGGGALLEGLREQVNVSFPNATLTQFYGASETSFITMANSQTPNGSVGVPYPDVTLRFTDTAGQKHDSAGEVWVKSPYVFDGYDQGTSADTRTQDGFITIGEYGRLDGNGNLFVQGRKSRMVTIADQNVFPEEIERFIADRFQPDHVVVLAQKDGLRGHRLTAILQGASIDESAILQACREAFGPLKSPRRVLAIEALPWLHSGKPDLITLAIWLEART